MLGAPRKLSAGQLAVMKSIIGPYLQRIGELQADLAGTQKALDDIAAAYLRGLGMDPFVNIDLVTGEVTPKPREQQLITPGPGV